MLCCSSSHIVGIGLRGYCPHGLKCWLYFPEDNCPFYRTTVFSHYAPKNCPSPDTELATICLVSLSSIALPGSALKSALSWSPPFTSASASSPVSELAGREAQTSQAWLQATRASTAPILPWETLMCSTCECREMAQRRSRASLRAAPTGP